MTSQTTLSASKIKSLLPSHQYRADIDGLRAIAVIAVVIFHAFPTVLKGGYVGVDVFFVISGYLISSIIFNGLNSGTFSFAEFYSRRIKRIFPALILVLTTCYVFGWFALFAEEYKQLGKHIASGAGFISNFVLKGEAGYFDNVAETKPLLHLWSLGIEEQFYLVWPALLYFAWRVRTNLFILTLGIFTLSFISNVSLINVDRVEAFYSPVSRFWELLVGTVLAYLSLYKRDTVSRFIQTNAGKALFRNTETLRNVASTTGFVLILLASFKLTKGKAFPGWWAIIPTVSAYLLISAGPNAWVNRKVLSHPFLVWCGLISFPLYLWHWPLLSFARIVESTTPSPLIRITAVTLSIGLAWLTYRFIERPIRFGKYGRTKVSALCLMMVLIGYIGYSTYQHDGLALRSTVKPFHDNRDQLKRTPDIDSQCKAFINNDVPLFPYCRYNAAGGTETVAIIGDSHAHAAFPGFSELMAEQGKNALLLANSSCPPFLGAVTGETEKEKGECDARIKALINTLIEKHSIKTVIISTRGPIYISGNGFGEAEKHYRNKPIQSLNKTSDVTSPDIIFGDALQRTVNALNQAGKKVYVLLENPEIGVDPAGCLNRPFRENKALNCSVKTSAVLDRQAAYREIIGSLKGITVIDPINAFCRNEVCTPFSAAKLLYADDDHLSVEGSRFQAREVLIPVIKN